MTLVFQYSIFPEYFNTNTNDAGAKGTLKQQQPGVGEITQWTEVTAIKSGNLNSIPITHMVDKKS